VIIVGPPIQIRSIRVSMLENKIVIEDIEMEAALYILYGTELQYAEIVKTYHNKKHTK